MWVAFFPSFAHYPQSWASLRHTCIPLIFTLVGFSNSNALFSKGTWSLWPNHNSVLACNDLFPIRTSLESLAQDHSLSANHTVCAPYTYSFLYAGLQSPWNSYAQHHLYTFVPTVFLPRDFSPLAQNALIFQSLTHAISSIGSLRILQALLLPLYSVPFNLAWGLELSVISCTDSIICQCLSGTWS